VDTTEAETAVDGTAVAEISVDETTAETSDLDIDVSALGAWRPGAEEGNIAAGSDAAIALAAMKPRRGFRSALLWSGVGFMTGAVFWQLAGLGSLASRSGLEDAPTAPVEFARAEAAALPELPDLDSLAPQKSAGNQNETAAQAPIQTAAVPAAHPEQSKSAEASTAPAAATDATAAAEPAPPVEAAAAANPEPVYVVDPASCTALEIDRSAKRTLVRPCPDSGLSLRLDHESGREDLAGLAVKLRPTGYTRE
jgi:hypothetical protein